MWGNVIEKNKVKEEWLNPVRKNGGGDDKGSL